MMYRKRMGRRRMGRKRVARRGLRRVRRAAPSIHKFKETYVENQSVDASATTVGTGILAVPGISQITNVASFRGMFDLYKITGVKYKFVPRYNVSDVGSTGVLPTLHTAINRSPFTPIPTDVEDVLNDDTSRTWRLDRPFNIYIKCPKPDMSVSYSVEGTQYVAPGNWQLGVSNKYQYWLTTGGNGASYDQSAIRHFGLRWALDNPNSIPVSVDVYTTLYFQCKEQD